MTPPLTLKTPRIWRHQNNAGPEVQKVCDALGVSWMPFIHTSDIALWDPSTESWILQSEALAAALKSKAPLIEAAGFVMWEWEGFGREADLLARVLQMQQVGAQVQVTFPSIFQGPYRVLDHKPPKRFWYSEVLSATSGFFVAVHTLAGADLFDYAADCYDEADDDRPAVCYLVPTDGVDGPPLSDAELISKAEEVTAAFDHPQLVVRSDGPAAAHAIAVLHSWLNSPATH